MYQEQSSSLGTKVGLVEVTGDTQRLKRFSLKPQSRTLNKN